MSIIQFIKNILKRFFPPPTKSFMREINDLKQQITLLSEGNERLLGELTQIHDENAKLLAETALVRDENAKLLAETVLVRDENAKLLAETALIRDDNIKLLDGNVALHEELSNQRKIAEKLSSEIVQLRKEAMNTQNQIRVLSWGNFKLSSMEAQYAYMCSLPSVKYAEELCKWYFQKTGNALNLTAPKSFNEKIQWMKLYDSTPLKTCLADKYLVREWIIEKVGEEYLIPLLGVWESFDDIDFEQLPDRFVLKANHGSGWNVVVTDKAAFDRVEAKEKFDKWLQKNFAFVFGFELHYLNIPPKIIAEKYIENTEGLKDYRFFCFNGVPVQVWVDIYSGTPNHLRSIYDMDWNKLPMNCTWPEGGELLSEKPESFEKMKELAVLFSKDFAFVRVDFFDVEGKLYIGEMTFTPMSGTGVFDPPEWDMILGNMLQLPPQSPIPERLL